MEFLLCDIFDKLIYLIYLNLYKFPQQSIIYINYINFLIIKVLLVIWIIYFIYIIYYNIYILFFIYCIINIYKIPSLKKNSNNFQTKIQKNNHYKILYKIN